MDTPAPRPRIAALDVARGVALLAMASFHFAWDLEFFGYLPPGATAHGFLKFYARSIASSFLFLVGVSLVLAHGGGVRWPPFLRRLAMVAGAALLISAGTYFAMPEEWIFFGILHEIALASVLGLAFLRVPALLTAAVAVLVIAGPHFLRHASLDHPALWWLGLAPLNPPSNDYVPLFPWYGAVLLGIAGANAARSAGLLARLATSDPPPRWTRPLSLLGRHSLLFYLVHQPVLIGLVWLFSQVAPAQVETREVRFIRSCEASCVEMRDEDFCSRYCACMLEGIEQQGLIEKVFERDADAQTTGKVGELASLCTATTEDVTIPAPD